MCIFLWWLVPQEQNPINSNMANVFINCGYSSMAIHLHKILFKSNLRRFTTQINNILPHCTLLENPSDWHFTMQMSNDTEKIYHGILSSTSADSVSLATEALTGRDTVVLDLSTSCNKPHTLNTKWDLQQCVDKGTIIRHNYEWN